MASVSKTPGVRRVGKYASTLRAAMSRHQMSIRHLSKATGFSYEHVRKVLSGAPVQSERFTQEVCRVLSLDADDMDGLSIVEKTELRDERLGEAPVLDTRFIEVWPGLSPDEQEQVLRYARRLADERFVERVDSGEAAPWEILRRIQQLTTKLARLKIQRHSDEDSAGD